MFSRNLIAAGLAISLASCAIAQPASQPEVSTASEGNWFIHQRIGDVAPSDGFFISMSDAKEYLKQRRDQDLSYEEMLKRDEVLRNVDEKQLANDAWCAKWCLPLSAGVGVVLGLVSGFLVVSAVKK